MILLPKRPKTHRNNTIFFSKRFRTNVLFQENISNSNNYLSKIKNNKKQKSEKNKEDITRLMHNKSKNFVPKFFKQFSEILRHKKTLRVLFSVALYFNKFT